MRASTTASATAATTSTPQAPWHPFIRRTPVATGPPLRGWRSVRPGRRQAMSRKDGLRHARQGQPQAGFGQCRRFPDFGRARCTAAHRDAVQSDDRNDRRRCRPVPSRRRNAAAAAAKVPRRRLECAFGAGMASLAGRLRSAPLAPATGVAGMEPGGPPGQPGDGSGGPRVGSRLVDRVMIPGQTCLGQGGVDLLVADVMNKHGRAALAALAARRQAAAALPAIRRHWAAARRADEAGTCRATASLPRAPAAAIGLAGHR